MATSMRPPMLPSYSLRVQLFSPNAHSSTDKPIRQFRVVISPDVTVRDFCAEASRIHEINYGEPLAVKKVQDDEGFDITQSEILGSLFATTSIIRVVQASATPSIRDSVPPTSALRFDPSASRKRGREGSARPDGNGSSNSYKPNKRQRVVNPDPDQPLPSREGESEVAGPSRANRRTSRENIIPDSQESIILGAQKVFNSRQVRQDLPMIPETPSPSPPPEAHIPVDKKQRLTDAQTQKVIDQSENNDLSFLSNADKSSPLREASVRAQFNISNSRAKSASYHIQRATERGTSVSTAATSPLSLDQRNNLENSGTSSSKRKRPSPKPILPTQNGNRFRSQNEQSLYENIVSEDEGSAVSRKKREAARSRNSPRPALPGTERANPNTPANGPRRTPAPRENANTPGELPLTPSSEERKRQQKKEADEANKARLAAAEAAEQRKREAEEVRQAEEVRASEEQRRQREEQERLDVEAFNQAEAEQKRKAIIENAARLQREREERERQEAEEARKIEQARIAREEAEERQRREESRATREKAATEARIAKEKQAEEEHLERERSAAEAERLREEEERIEREKAEAAAEEQRKAEAEAKVQKASRRSSANDRSRHSKSASPALPKVTPIPAPNPQSSSTSFFPNGRKSSLKHSLSSQALRSSSPAGSKPSPDGVSPGVGIEDQMPLPNKLNRKVSFNEETITPRKETPILPPRRILPPGAAKPPKSVVQKEVVQIKAAPNKATPKESTPKPPASKPLLLPTGKESHTPIPVPKTVSRSSQERSSTPTAQTKVSPPLRITPRTSSKLLVANQTLKKYGRAAAASQKNEKAKPAEQPEEEEVSSDDESEENVSSKILAKRPSIHQEFPAEIVSSNTTIKFEPAELRDEDEDEDGDEDEDAKIDEDETQSQISSLRDSSRSPVTFTQQPQLNETPKPQRAVSPEEDDSSEEDEEQDEEVDSDASDASNAEETPKGKTTQKSNVASSKPDEESGSEQSESEEDEDEEDEEEEESEVQVPKSSPELPPYKRSIKPTMTKPGLKPSKSRLSDLSINTQDEVDQQLTSSLYEALSAPSSSVPPHIPASSNAMITKPKIGFGIGASLSSLNKASATLAASSQAKANGARSSSQKLQLAHEEENSDEESEEESEEDDDDSSADEEEEAPENKKSISTTIKRSFRVEDTQKDSDQSDSESDSGSSGDEEEEKQRLGQELMSQVNAMNSMANGGSQDSIPSPKMYRSGTQDTPKAKKAPEKKKSNNLLTGYVFSPPA